MKRISWPLSIEQLAIIATITVAILMGIGWGLPSKKRMDLLLEGGAPTPRQVRILNSLHTLRAGGQLAGDSLPARRVFEISPGSIPEWYSSTVPGPWLAFTEAERLYMLRSYILSSSAMDEELTLVAIGRMNPKKLDLDPKAYSYGGSYLYPVGFLLFVMKSAGLLHVTQDLGSYLHDPSQIARIYLVGRLLNLLAFVGTLIVLALLGRLLRNETAGTMSLLTYGLSTLILEYTVVMKPHVFTAFWIALAVYLLLLYMERGARRFLVFSVLAAGYAAGSSAPAAAIGLLYPVLLFERGRGHRTVRECLGAWAGMAIVFMAMNPYVLIHIHTYLSWVSAEASDSVTGLGVFDVRKLRWYLPGAFVKSYTFPLGLMGLGFMVWCCFRGSGPLRRLALATAALFLLFGVTSPMVRISSFLAPLYGLFAGIAVSAWITAPLQTKRLLRGSCVVLLFLPGVVNAGLLLRDIVCDTTWYEPTARWVRSARIGPGSTIGLLFGPAPVVLPPFPFLHTRLIDMNAAAAAVAPPDYVIVGNYPPVARRLWMAHPLRARYRVLYDLGYRSPLDWLRIDQSLNDCRIGGFVYERVDRSPADTRRSP